jgi:putative drug exporter of the RND superfamily
MNASRMAGLPCGRWTKWIILVLWLVILGIAAPLAGKLTGAQKNEASSWLPQNAESTQVLNLSEQFRSSDVYPALIVYDRGGAAITAADVTKATSDVPRLRGVQHVVQVVGPVKSKDGQALQTIVQVKFPSNEGWDALPPIIEGMRSIAGGNAAGMSTHVTGPAGYSGDFGDVFSGFDSTLLYITAVIVILILLLTYRSPILWALPLVVVFVSLTAAQAVIYLLAKNAGLTVNGQSAFILTVLVFGAGTDYALLLIARYREELRRHEDRHEAMAFALRRAGPAIIASGATVILSLLVLLVAELNSTKSLGPVMAIGVGVGLCAMVTLLPALLVIFGRWLFWPVRPRYGTAEPTERGLWAGIGRRIALRPRLTWVVTAVILGGLAFGMTGLKADGLSNSEAFRTSPDSVAGEQVLSKHFPAGAGNPVQVIGAAQSGPQMAAALAGVSGVTDVTQPVVRGGYAYVEGTLNAVADSKAAFDTVERARTTLHAVPGADAKVGGGSAVTMDINAASQHDRNLVVPIVLVVVFLILSVVLRALLAPLILVATVLLSFGAALGVSAFFFNHVFGFAGADPSFPLWGFVFLVALGVDYNIFLMTRVHEEARQHGTRRGALIGLAATGGVITSAGAVLAGTFAALGSLPLVFVTELGFVVAFGVLLDTFIVRSVLVTAINLDVGRHMWWPSKLAKEREPTLSEVIEGQATVAR